MELSKIENTSVCVTSNSATKNIIEILKAKNKELCIDISVLKRLVYMLNVELEFRDSSTQSSRHTLESQQKSVTASKPADQILHWNHEDIAMIAPLLRAFHQTKEEKDQLVANYKHVFDDLSLRCKEIILENVNLREELRATKEKASVSCGEWKKIRQELFLVKEHNELLTRQIKLLQSKVRSIESVYKTSLKQYEIERQDLIEKYDATKTELLLLKGRFSVLNQVNNPFQHQVGQQNESNSHNIITKEIQNLSVELKLHNANDINSMKKKIIDLEKVNANMNVQIIKISSERDHLKGYLSAVESEARKLNRKYEELEKDLEDARKSQGDARKQIIKCMSFIRELVSVHNMLLDQVNKTENSFDGDVNVLAH